MAGSNGRDAEQVKQEIAREREQLVRAVADLRGEAAGVSGRVRSQVPILAAGALSAGFVLAGGIGATMRLLARRGREGNERMRLGRFAVVDRD